jgi:tetratricopeptide (TPR) repeat protein
MRVRRLAPAIKDDSERSRLDLAACTQILSRGWRGGLSSDQLAECFEHGQTLARAANDRVALARLTAAYGTFRGLAGGSYDDHVRYACEAVSIADEVGDRRLSVAVGSHYAFARMFQGRPHEVLSACDAVLGLVGDDPQFGRKQMGYSPLAGMLFGRGVALSWAGRLEEARSQLELGYRVSTEVGDREAMTWISQYWPYMAWLLGGPESGLQQAQRAFDLAEDLGNGSSRVIAHASLGIAHTLEANYADAISMIEKALELIEELNTHRTFRPRVLASLAEAQAFSGLLGEACRNAEEAISQTGGGGVGAYAVYARLVMVRICLGEGADSLVDKVPACLGSAEDLIEKYDIACYRPHALELRAHLAQRAGDVQSFSRLATEARRLYREIGAHGHEERLAGSMGP